VHQVDFSLQDYIEMQVNKTLNKNTLLHCYYFALWR